MCALSGRTLPAVRAGPRMAFRLGLQWGLMPEGICAHAASGEGSAVICGKAKAGRAVGSTNSADRMRSSPQSVTDGLSFSQGMLLPGRPGA
jgi:hypothetical protein